MDAISTTYLIVMLVITFFSVITAVYYNHKTIHMKELDELRQQLDELSKMKQDIAEIKTDIAWIKEILKEKK
jgi:uncharacterized membrane protein (DUF106 family)